MNKVGRPTKYDFKFCDEIIKYFDQEPHFASPVVTTYKDGTTKEEVKFIPCDLPTLAGFASKIKVCRDTLHEWDEKHKEFSDAIKRCKDLQENILITNGLKGLYAQPFAIMAAKNIISWKDKQEISGDKESPLEIKTQLDEVQKGIISKAVTEAVKKAFKT